MKKKKKCPICDKKMLFRRGTKSYECIRCGYPDKKKYVEWRIRRNK